MQSSVTTLASLLERTFPAGLSGLIFDCDGVMVDSRDVNIGYYNLLLREVGKPPITPEQAGYVQMSTAKEALEYIFSPEELKLLPAIAERYPYRGGAVPQWSLNRGWRICCIGCVSVASGSGSIRIAEAACGICWPASTWAKCLILS